MLRIWPDSDMDGPMDGGGGGDARGKISVELFEWLLTNREQEIAEQ